MLGEVEDLGPNDSFDVLALSMRAIESGEIEEDPCRQIWCALSSYW